MKIALAVHDLVDSVGHGRYTRVLADMLATRHEVTVYANRRDRFPAARWRFRRVPAWRSRALASVLTFPAGMRLRGPAPECFDIVHAQGYCGGAPNVVTAHACQEAYRASLVGASTRTRASLAVMARAEAAFYRGFRGPIIAISHRVARDVAACYGFSGRCHVVPHGVDHQRFHRRNRRLWRARMRRDLGVAAGQPLLLYVGDLAKAHIGLCAVARSCPEVALLAVTRSTQYRFQAPNARFLPPTPHVERFYAAADALVFPTTYDAFGMVVLEAMASGLPVFCSDAAGASELINHGVDGIVIPLGRFADDVRDGLGDADRLREIGRAAARAARRFAWEEMVGQVEAVYQQVARPCAVVT